MPKITLKFDPELVPLVINGEKDCTWRLWDDKDLKPGDELVLIARPNLTPFAKAVVSSVFSKTMGMLTDDDKKGHEPFKSDQEMFETYSRYYGKPVGPETPVKIVRFKITKVMPEYRPKEPL